MLISCNKLKSHIKNSEDIDWLNIWDKFTIRTAEVEEVYEVGNTFDNVVVAEIKECVEHPDSDHMHVLMVDCGEKDLIQVVCGANNVRVGLKTAYIKVGGHIDGTEITAKKLRGVMSNGMCCSFRELSIGEDHDGIIELPEDAPVGMDIKEYLPINDIIVEIDNKSLTNRPDLWGHYGIAREIAAITEHELLPIKLEEVENNKEDLNITIKDPELCYRYCGLKLENILNNKTPIEMQIFLNYIGMRSISLLVDVTNYIMAELGQPMHAFDARVVKNIEVGTAETGDVFTTLDGKERKLNKDTLMIKNGDNYFGIAGVMGGLNSEILPDTTSTFIESATFNAGSIRRTAVNLGLRTDASAHYEKSLDPNIAPIAIKRALYLIKQVNPEIVIASNLTDIYPTKTEVGHIILKKDKLKKYIGKDLPEELVINILSRLEFEVEDNGDVYEITVPTFRHTKDVFIEQDVIEEIARIYGLENFEPKPLKLDLKSHEHETIFNQEYEVKRFLATKYDMHEVHSYIWYDTDLLNELNIQKTGVKLLAKNTNNILRDDLSLSLMNIVNLNFKNYNKFKIFEIATIIENNQTKRVLSIILADEEKNLENIYNESKKIVTYLFSTLKNKKIDITKNNNVKDYYDANLSKLVSIDSIKYGELNVLEKKYVNKLSKKKAIVCIDIDFDKFGDLSSEILTVSEVSKYPVVNLDYTIIADKDTKYSYILEVINNFKHKYVISHSLKNIYEDQNNLKYTINYVIGSNEKTLDQGDLFTFKTKFINHVRDNNLEIIE